MIAKELERAIDAEFRRMPTTCGCCASRRNAAATSWPSSPSCSSGEPFDRMPLSTLIEEVVAPHRNFGVAINVALLRG